MSGSLKLIGQFSHDGIGTQTYNYVTTLGPFVIRGPNYLVKIIAKFFHVKFVDFYF